LANSNQTTWTYHGPIRRFVFQDSTVVNRIKTAVENNEPLDLVPAAPDFPAIGSIVYHPEDVLTCVQITIRNEHPIAISGLRCIQRWLKYHTLTSNLCPKKELPWRFVFIVPQDMASSFTLQTLEGDTAGEEWSGKVNQYVLGWDVGNVKK